MSFTDQNDPNDPQLPKDLRDELKRVKKENKELRERAAKADEYEQREAFVKAGVPVDDPRARYFMAGFAGEKTPEAIKAEWEATFGATQPGQRNDTGNPAIPAEIAALQQVTDIGGGGFELPPDKLAERDAKLRALSPTDPRYDEKFNEVFEAYGGVRGGLVG